MGAGLLKRWVEGAGAGLTWIEYDDYAGRVFAGAPPDWLSQAVRFANTLGQARKVVRTDVLTIDLTAPCRARAPADGSPVDRVRAGLDDAAARAFGTEVLDALAHKFAGEVDLVLKVASPRDLLRDGGEDGEPSFDDLDEVASALSGLLRALSDKPVAALLVARGGDAPWSADEVDAIDPLFSAAHHYGWLAALAVAPPLLATATAVSGVDLVLCPAAEPAQLGATQAPRVGGGLDTTWWRGDAAARVPSDGLAYGIIPVDAEPEHVVARCASLG